MANRGRSVDSQVFCIKDLERLGSAKLPIAAREYYNEGAMDLITLHDNENAYNRYRIRPRVMRNVSNPDTSTAMFGVKVKFPFGFSPTANQVLAHPSGEVATSKAAAAMNVPMGLSSYSTATLEDVIAQGKGNPYGIQIPMLKNRDAMINLIRRAEKSGFKAAIVTLDCPRLGKRLNEYRNAFSLPKGMEYPNLFPGVDLTNLEEGNELMDYDDSLEWEEMIEFLRKDTKLELWGKGVYTREDVELAIRYGFDGLIVSNHGGRQLDTVPATLDTLRDIAPAAKGRIPLAIDGGVRRGTDIFKALALGADFVFAGRPAIWGLAYDGERGVKIALDILYDEFVTCMALAGCRRVADIKRDHIALLLADGVLAKL